MIENKPYFSVVMPLYNKQSHVKEAIENTGKIADRINIEIELNNWHFAPVDLPEGKTADDHLGGKPGRSHHLHAPGVIPRYG